MFKRKYAKKTSLGKRIIRSGVSVVALTGFVLGISFFVKGLYSLDSQKFSRLTSPILGKLGLSENEAGEVAGEFVSRIAQTGVNEASVETEVSAQEIANVENEVASIAIFADSANEFENLTKAVNKANELEADYIVHLGDLSDWGDVESLQTSKDVLAQSNLDWTVLPGDHDLGQSVGTENFLEVFSQNYKLVEVAGLTLLIFDNSANFTPLDEASFTWFLENVINADYVFLSQPLYHPTNNRIMGAEEGDKQQAIISQRDILLSKVRNSNVKAIFAGDQHISSTNSDSVDTSLTHYVVGALAKSRNFQTPRFTLLTILDDGTYDVQEILL